MKKVCYMCGLCLKSRTVWFTDQVLIENIVEIVNYSHINEESICYNLFLKVKI